MDESSARKVSRACEQRDTQLLGVKRRNCPACRALILSPRDADTTQIVFCPECLAASRTPTAEFELGGGD